jgi:glycosyltransferase 2 family protein
MRRAQLLFHPLVTVLRYGLTLGLIGGLVAWVDWGQFAGLGGRVEGVWALLGLGLAGLAYAAHAARFQVLLVLQELPISYGRSVAITLLGQFYNAFLPTGIGGDLARLHQVFRLHPGAKAGGATAVLVDRLLGFGSLLILGALALAAHAHGGRLAPATVGEIGWPLAGASLLFLAAVIVGIRLPPARWPVWFTSAAARFLGAERWAALCTAHQRALGQPRRQAACWAWSVAVWAAEFASAWALARAVGLEVSATGLVLAVVVANLAAVLPLAIGGHGVREGALVGALALVEAEAGLLQEPAAIAFALLFLAANLLWSAAGALVMLRPSEKPSTGGRRP